MAKIKSSSSEYVQIHKWLLKNKVKTGVCTHCECSCDKTENALISGREHEKDLGNYIELCPACHRKYDAHLKVKVECDNGPVGNVLSVKMFSEKYGISENSIYQILRNNKNLKIKVRGLGLLISEGRYQRLIVSRKSA